MNESSKHVMDVLTFLSAVAAWLKVFTDIIGFFVVLAGAAWWVIRYYEFFKGKKHGNE